MVDNIFRVIQTMSDIHGIAISQYDDMFLEQVIAKRLTIDGSGDIDGYITFISDNSNEAHALLNTLNISYTEFFRNTLTYAHLEHWILPKLIDNKLDNCELRIWSAGCSTGQEAYSIALLIEKIMVNRHKSLRYRIIATDMSEIALQKARKGEYSEDDIRNIKFKDTKDYFVKKGDTYYACDLIRKHVSFTSYDLLDDRSAFPQESIFGNFDLVLCCNLMFYYKNDVQMFILDKLVNSIAEQGYLVTGEAERQTVARHGGLHLVTPPSPIFQKRF